MNKEELFSIVARQLCGEGEGVGERGEGVGEREVQGQSSPPELHVDNLCNSSNYTVLGLCRQNLLFGRCQFSFEYCVDLVNYVMLLLNGML